MKLLFQKARLPLCNADAEEKKKERNAVTATPNVAATNDDAVAGAKNTRSTLPPIKSRRKRDQENAKEVNQSFEDVLG